MRNGDSAKRCGVAAKNGRFAAQQFDERFFYDGDDLGATLGANFTTFKVWSPVSARIVLNLYNEGDGGEAYATHDMTKTPQGVWEYAVPERLDGKYYTYTVYNDVYPDGAEIVDPYAKSAGLSGKRGMVADFDSVRAKPAGWDEVAPHAIDANELVVWETHVADVTSSATWNGNEAHRKKFLGMIESGTTFTKNGVTVKTGFDHIVELGVNAVQLLPVFDQANDEADMTFNWGYNPLNYNVIEGGYSTDARDGYVRIKEFRQLVQAFNGAGINVIMDVVYNHVNAAAGSNFDVLAPGYYFRYDADGNLTNGSGCGNDTATERPMMRKFVIDSVCFLAKTYKLGGFRFDLMGLHDLETMNLLVAELRKINPDIIVYGEPWNMATVEGVKLAHQGNAKYYANGLAQFNDIMRDALVKSGLCENAELGWVSDGKVALRDILNGMKGRTGRKIPDMYKTVNYVTCHDNFTLKDRMIATGKISASDAKAHAMLANSVVLTSNGIAFVLAGEEFLRSKADLATPELRNSEAVHNSYRYGYEMNSLNYELKVDNADMFANYRKLIAFKKKFVKDFDLTSNAKVVANYKVKTVGGKRGVIVATVAAKDGSVWKIIHANARGSKAKLDLDGYKPYLDTSNNATLTAHTPIAAYQTLIVCKERPLA